jgi:hypothetical protein
MDAGKSIILFLLISSFCQADELITLKPTKFELYTWQFDCTLGYKLYYELDKDDLPLGMPDSLWTNDLRDYPTIPWSIVMCEMELDKPMMYLGSPTHTFRMQSFPDQEEYIIKLNENSSTQISILFSMYIQLIDTEAEKVYIVLWFHGIPFHDFCPLMDVDLSLCGSYYTEEEKKYVKFIEYLDSIKSPSGQSVIVGQTPERDEKDFSRILYTTISHIKGTPGPIKYKILREAKKLNIPIKLIQVEKWKGEYHHYE